jgi:hypothetical protein
METIFRVYYVARLQRAISEGRFPQGGARFQRGLPWAGMFCAFSAENQRGDRKTQTHRPSYTKQPTLKKICANLRNLRIKNVCYQSVTAYQPSVFCLS